MNDYVIINGKNSNTITGLAINLQPPISKPPMRVLTETIDGRDGDLNTDLGYGSYDKTITVGLWGSTYDINNIIGFFNGEGTIVFSNEPDKYYNFKIINQIDYDKLLKFRTASITLHCQPFKYPLTETPVEITPSFVEDEAEIMSLNNTGIGALELDLKGNTSQTGTPTPSSPVNVNVVSGDNEVVVCGKNLFNLNDLVKGRLDSGNIGYANGTDSLTYGDTSFTFTTNSGYRGVSTNSYISVLPQTRYYVSWSSTSTITIGVACYDKNKTWLGNANAIATSGGRYYETLSNTSYIRVQVLLNSAGTCTVNNFQLEKTGITTYEPYTSQSYNINLGTIELCEIGTYQDYIYKTDKWYLHKEVGKVVLNGSESWQDRPNYSYADRFAVDAFLPTMKRTMYSNYFEVVNGLPNTYPYLQNNDTQLVCNYSAKGTTTLAQYKTWLSANTPNIYYILSNRTNTEITNTTLINQLEQLKGAMSYEGQTNISQVNNDKPFILSAKALQSGSNEGTINNLGNIYSKPIIDIEGTGVVDIYLNGTQVFQVDTTDVNEIVIDSGEMEAYDPNTNNLANRKVVGDYETFKVPSGTNTIKVEGAITKATISKFTRWL